VWKTQYWKGLCVKLACQMGRSGILSSLCLLTYILHYSWEGYMCFMPISKPKWNRFSHFLTSQDQLHICLKFYPKDCFLSTVAFGIFKIDDLCSKFFMHSFYLQVVRYHSCVINADSLPKELIPIAWTTSVHLLSSLNLQKYSFLRWRNKPQSVVHCW